MRSSSVTRAAGLAWSLAALAGSAPEVSSQQPRPDSTRTIAFETEEGTWMNVSVSPNGQTILFDLLGHLYTLPIAGGIATPLATGRSWNQMATFSPDGKSIAWISDRDGAMNLWIMDADGSHPRQLSHEYRAALSSPTWTPDGEYVIAARSGSPASLLMFDRSGGAGVEIAIGQFRYTGPSVSSDERYLYYAGGGAQPSDWQVYRLDRLTGVGATMTVGGANFRPVASPDGRWLAYARRDGDATALYLRDIASGAERRLIARVTHDQSEWRGTNQDVLPGYAFMPDAQSIVLTIGGTLHRVDVSSGVDHVIPFRARVSREVDTPPRVAKRIDDGPVRPQMLRWPTLSPDGRTLAFSTLGHVWITDVPNCRTRRLTTSSDFEYTPTWSPDGKWIAYTTWNDTLAGHIMVARSDGSHIHALTTTPGQYASLAWSPDGTKVGFVSTAGVELRHRPAESAPFLELRWVAVAGGESHLVTTLRPNAGLRFFPSVAFGSDGTRIYFAGRALSVTDASSFLSSVRLDGSDVRTHIRMKLADEMVPAPDGKHAIIGARDDLWVVTLPSVAAAPIELSLANPAVPAKRITSIGGIYPSWQNAAVAIWSFGHRIYRYQVNADRADTLVDVQFTVPAAGGRGVVAFRNARLVTMQGDQVLERGTIVVTGSRITAVGLADSVRIPAGATIIDAAGKTIMPGLVDVHAHIGGYSAPEMSPQRKPEYVASLAYGMTTAFDPSARSVDVFAQAEMVRAGAMIGPRIFSSGDPVMGEDRSAQFVDLRSLDDARRVVRQLAGYGATMLKEYNQPRRDQRQWLVQAARESGVAITAEGGGDQALDLSMVVDGYTAFEHNLPIAPLYRDVVEFVARSGVFYTPTLIVSYGGLTGGEFFENRVDTYDDHKWRRFAAERSASSYHLVSHIADDEWHFRLAAADAAHIEHSGGLVAVGAHGYRPALGTHWEMWILQMGGFTPLEAMRAATITAAQKIGYDRDLGSLAVGKLADFLVLNANPLDDIHNTAALEYTVQGGVVYDAESMTEVWPEYKRLGRMIWQTPEDVQRFVPTMPVHALTGAEALQKH